MGTLTESSSEFAAELQSRSGFSKVSRALTGSHGDFQSVFGGTGLPIDGLLANLKGRVADYSGQMLSERDFALLLRGETAPRLEELAQAAQQISRYRYGNSIQLFAPLYLSNECNATCTYCSFSFANKLPRTTLNEAQLRREAGKLYGMGIRHVLLLTGEDRKKTSVSIIADAVRILKEKFPSVSLEIYGVEESEYETLLAAGAEGLILYQETYDREVYSQVHLGGKKKNFDWRLGALERAGSAGFRRLGIGALLGLSGFRAEVFMLGLHARYLATKFWQSTVSISLPRIRPAIKSFKNEQHVADKELAQMYLALRLFVPDVHLVMSTRESASFRENMAKLGINQMSTGSKTEPGGYSDSGALEQFSIEDNRPPHEFVAALRSHGLNPVFKDWDNEIL